MRQFTKSRLLLGALPCALLCTARAPAEAQPGAFRISSPQPGVTVIADDTGNWGGQSLGTSHQNQAQYWTQKQITIPPGALQGIKEARLRVFMALQDYSYAKDAAHPNGLDESFTLLVNDHAHQYQDSEPFLRGRITPAEPLTWRWTDFEIPVGELKTGENTFVFHKNHSDKNDDYLYIGIDDSVALGHSRMSLNSGQSWTEKELNTIKATGEYMVRLLLLKETPRTFAVWTPDKITDPHHLIGYAGIGDAGESGEGRETHLNLELDRYRVDAAQPLRVVLKTGGAAPPVLWHDENGRPITARSSFADGVQRTDFPAGQKLAKVQIPVDKTGRPMAVEVRIEYSLPIGMRSTRVNMAPRISAPQGQPAQRAPQISVTANGFTAQNATQIAQFETKPRLRLRSLHNEYLQKNVLAHPAATHLFLTEIGGKRYGAEDWTVQSVRAVSPTQVQVQLALPETGLEALFTVGMDAQKMNFGLKMTNTAKSTQSWKTAFPQFGGLQLSQNADDDYYLFPLWGGAIASQNVNLRTFYGDESAWWQMIDLFSPAGGAGLTLRNLDETGLYKGVALRKGEAPTAGGTFAREVRTSYMTEDMGWNNSLDAGPGTALGFEYLKYTRSPGGSFAPPDAALEMHPGDWHTAMQTYAGWAHTVWKWRPFPSKLRDIWNIQAAGWGQNPLFKDGRWRTDFINDKADVSELMSWWQWSKKGPWQVPMDQLEEGLGEAFFKAYKSYWVVNPATGQLEYPLNRGDYEYNTDWGGLPALRAELQAIRDGGQMPMFYTDPILADDNTRLGHEHGPQYGVMNPLWKASGYASEKKTPPGYVGSYGGYCMCLDNEWYQEFVVNLTARLVRDTGVEGIRFDEFGHRGYTCFNPRHQHLFAEEGHNAWLQAIAQVCRRTHEAVDKIEPDFVLTAEFPGYDHLAANLEGAINYESAQHVFEGFRPVPLNVFRFYFPEHKPFDLDNKRRVHGEEWRFWNATGAFSHLHPPRYHRILQENGDAFDSRDATPLIPTLAEGVYANRFIGGDKTFTLLYNASGFTVDKPLLAAPAKTGFHYFDLLGGREITPHNDAITLELAPDKVAVVAQLPQVLMVRKTGAGHQAQLQRAVPDAAVALCNAEGEELARQRVTGQAVLLPQNDEAAYVKLFSGKYLVDAATM